MKILFHYPLALYFHDPGGSYGNFFYRNEALSIPSKGKKTGEGKGKMREGEEAKDEEAVSLFAFCACKNVGSCDCA